MRIQKKGLAIDRHFTKDGVDPFDAVEWDIRDAKIVGSGGKVFFEQRDVEFPKAWSQTACNVVSQKYFRGTLGTPEREYSVKQLITRVVDTITKWGYDAGYFSGIEYRDIFRDELKYMLLHQMMAFNSPVWFNVGIDEKPQVSACFINSVEDTMDSILDLIKTEGMLFKGGSGSGVNLSTLRSSHEGLRGGGTASGPVSFMRGLDASAGVIKSGGRSRRAACMRILNASHPDIMDFIKCKATEEKKAHALIDAGYDGEFNVPGGAYDTIAYQNANHSVRVDDDFMNAVVNDMEWETKGILNDKPVSRYRARDIMRAAATAAWECGDPGMQFDTTINTWNTCPESGRINASNPCSEYMHLDDSACNLASLNLLKFLVPDERRLDIRSFRHAVDVTIVAMDILIDGASYPTEKIGETARSFRQLGLGYANLGALLMRCGIPYDSNYGRRIAAAITSLMSARSYSMSAKLATEVGPFAGYKTNEDAMDRVMIRHRAAAKTVHIETVDVQDSFSGFVAEAALHDWNNVTIPNNGGFRNSQTTVLAPTGTIAFLMDCDTTGIEPELALIKYKKLVGGGDIKIVNQGVESALERLGYQPIDIHQIMAHVEETGSTQGAAGLLPQHIPVFDCALAPASGGRSIDYMGHIKMMAAVQPFLSGAISKTVNMPHDCTVEDIETAYMAAWKLGLKAIAVYRDGCKRTQPLSTSSDSPKVVVQAGNLDGPPTPVRRRLPDERDAKTSKFSVGGHEGYITVGLYEDGQPGEIFIRMAKEGSTIAGLMDSFATAISMALQHGVPLRSLCDKFKGTRFEPSGFTGNQEFPIATSVMDYIFRWLEARFLTAPDDLQLELPLEAPKTWVQDSGAPSCHECGTLMVRNGSCHRCPNCGSTSGCS